MKQVNPLCAIWETYQATIVEMLDKHFDNHD